MAFNILVVDDSRSIRAVIKKIVFLSGFNIEECYEAKNGREALEVLSHHWVDIIISDINMPEMDGMEFLNALKKDELFKQIPVIFVTAEGSEERIEQAMRAGVGGFLRKPFLPEELRSVLTEVIGLDETGKYISLEEGADF